MHDALLKEFCGGERRYRIFRTLFSEPKRTFHLRGLAAAADVDPSNLARQLPRFIAAGLVERIEGEPQPRYRANPAAAMNRKLMALFKDPPPRSTPRTVSRKKRSA